MRTARSKESVVTLALPTSVSYTHLVQWALGASMLLYFKGITSEFHDIDLLVSEHDAECVRRILSEMGELCPPDPMPNPMYRTKAFMEFLIDSIEVDDMAGFLFSLRSLQLLLCT